MWWVIRASDIEDQMDAINLEKEKEDALKKEWEDDGVKKENEWVKKEEEDNKKVEDDPSRKNEEDDPEKKTEDSKTEPVNLDDVSDEELEAMSDEELDALLSGIEDDQEKKTEDIDKGSSEEDVDFALKEKDALMKSISDRLEKKVRENADLKVQLAEKNIFWDGSQENMIAFHDNIWKARWGDEEAKAWVLTFLDNMRKEMTWKTFWEDDIDKDTDKISESNSIKPWTDPSTPDPKWGEDYEIKVL